MHLIQLEKPQQCINALSSPAAAKPVRRVLNLTFPSCISPTYCQKANNYGHSGTHKQTSFKEMRAIRRSGGIYLISSTKGINRNQKIEVPDSVRVRDTERERERQTERKNAQILQCLFFLLHWKLLSCHWKCASNRSEVRHFQVNNLVGNGNNESGQCFV